MSPRPDVSAERKNQILEAALRVFARRGFYKARMDDIAEEAHLSKGALYWYFRGKDAILQALVDKMFTLIMRDMLHTAADHDRPVPERLRQVARSAEESVGFFEAAMPFMHEIYALATRPGPVRTTMQGYYRRYKAVLADLLAEGMARGELRSHDPAMMAVAFIVQFEGLLLLWVVSPEDFDLHAHWQPMAEFFIQSLLPEMP